MSQKKPIIKVNPIDAEKVSEKLDFLVALNKILHFFKKISYPSIDISVFRKC